MTRISGCRGTRVGQYCIGTVRRMLERRQRREGSHLVPTAPGAQGSESGGGNAPHPPRAIRAGVRRPGSPSRRHVPWCAVRRRAVARSGGDAGAGAARAAGESLARRAKIAWGMHRRRKGLTPYCARRSMPLAHDCLREASQVCEPHAGTRLTGRTAEPRVTGAIGPSPSARRADGAFCGGNRQGECRSHACSNGEEHSL